MSLARKFKRKGVQLKPAATLTEAEYKVMEEAIKKQVLEEVVFKVLAVAADIIVNHYGKLKKRETRLDVLAEMYAKELEHFDGGREEIAKRLEHFGMKVTW